MLGVCGGEFCFGGVANSAGKLSELVLVLRRTNLDGSDGTVATIFFTCTMAAQTWTMEWAKGHSSLVGSEIGWKGLGSTRPFLSSYSFHSSSASSSSGSALPCVRLANASR